MKYDVADLSLVAKGKKRILWADNDMPVLAAIRNGFSRTKPLKGQNVSACLHITAETANLARTLSAPQIRSVHRMMSPLPWSRTFVYLCLPSAARTEPLITNI
jgi:S-adenosylhomocysteine hydrolase